MATLVVNMPRAGAVTGFGVNDGGYARSLARITQIGGSGMVYAFPYAPVEVEFMRVGAEYQEIDRPGRYALIDQKAPSLLKGSFEFRIAHRPSNGLQSIEADLATLHLMATDDAPVSITGLGSYFSGVGSPSPTGGHVKFRITDLSVKVVRRGPSNEPWQADCKIDVVEDRNPIFATATMTQISYPAEPAAATTSTGGSGNKSSGSTKPAGPSPSLSTYSKSSNTSAAALAYQPLSGIRTTPTKPALPVVRRF